jgi:hypothetical protein
MSMRDFEVCPVSGGEKREASKVIVEIEPITTPKEVLRQFSDQEIRNGRVL